MALTEQLYYSMGLGSNFKRRGKAVYFENIWMTSYLALGTTSHIHPRFGIQPRTDNAITLQSMNILTGKRCAYITQRTTLMLGIFFNGKGYQGSKLRQVAIQIDQSDIDDEPIRN